MCSETASYVFYGLDFGWLGAGFFSLMILLLLLRRYVSSIGAVLIFGIWAAAGAEVRLVWIQKYDIGSWCPVCLCIAVTVATATLVVSYEAFAARKIFGVPMKAKFIHLFVTLVALSIGFASALFGVQKEAGAADLDIYFGKRKSDTTVYFVSDWFCPVCRKIEPDIEKMYPELAATVRIAFVDMPIHPESANITPYHLQFMLYEKDKYIPLRHVLDEISRTTNNPTQDQMQTAVARLGVTLRPPNFMEILNGVRQFETIYKGFKVSATPTVVVDNSKTKKRKLLVGGNEISRNTVKAAIAEVEK
jgi:thiol-disulfide isomerase/thioredoxin